MIQSFDWILHAKKNSALKQSIVCHMESGDHLLILKDVAVTFSQSQKKATVRRNPDQFPINVKIVPAEIPYDVLTYMLNGNWDDCRGIVFLNEE